MANPMTAVSFEHSRKLHLGEALFRALLYVAALHASRHDPVFRGFRARMRQNGVELINTEMAVFELLGKAGTPEFKSLSALIR